MAERRGGSGPVIAFASIASALAMTVAGCDGGTAAGPEPVPTPEPGEAPGLGRAGREDVPPAGRAPDPSTSPEPSVDACDDGDFAAVDGTVADQLDAFAADDWQRAYALASEEFRRGVTLDDFVTLVEEHFPAVADPAGHTSTDCRTDGSKATILVTVTGRTDDARTYLYLLLREDGGWRVSGAAAAATPEPGDV